MKLKLQLIVSTAAASVLTLSAVAQEAINTKTNRGDYTPDGIARVRSADRLNSEAKVTDLVGQEVKNYQNEILGKVQDLAIDMASGQIVQVILTRGGIAGNAAAQTAVPPSAFRHYVAQKVLYLDVSKAKLDGAPPFETSKWADSFTPDQVTAVYNHYGQKSALNLAQTNNAPNAINLDGLAPEDKQRFQAGSSRQVEKASKLLGLPVKNLQDEKIGSVQNILAELSSGRVLAVIVSSGGFLGIEDELSAIPSSAFRFSSDHDVLLLDTTKERLSSAPHFGADLWPALGQTRYADKVDRAYGVGAYSTNLTTQVDNTSINARDRDGRMLTPLDQGNSKADIATTAQIRKEIVATKNISIKAQNVKIISNQGQVTLRGPVDTKEEKRLIGEIANRIARSENVDNQLEVKLTPTGRD